MDLKSVIVTSTTVVSGKSRDPEVRIEQMNFISPLPMIPIPSLSDHAHWPSLIMLIGIAGDVSHE